MLGQERETTCPDCGTTVGSVLVPVKEFLFVWDFERHSCPEMESRKAAETEEQARKHSAFLEHPTPKRIEEVRCRVRLPHWTPAGMKNVVRARVPVNAFNAFQRHRKEWLNGERPQKGIWIYGATDAGKTTLLSALLFDINHRTNRPCLSWNVADLMDHLRRDARGVESEYDPAEIADAEIIALDDLGTIKTTERVWETLFDIVCAVSDAWGAAAPRQTLYVTSNEGPEQMIQRLSTPDNPDGGERIVRRLLQLTEQVEVRA